MRKLVVFWGAAVIAVLSACSNPKDATESNFKIAVQAYLDAEYPKCYFSGNFPTKSSKMDGDRNASLRVLANTGLLSEKEVARKEIGGIFGLEKKTVITYEYELTEEGKKYYQVGANKNLGGNVGGFCAGSAKVASIEEFSEPADMFGNKVSKVRYSYVVSNIPTRLHSEELVKLSRSLKEDVASQHQPIVETKAMILTNHGWVHERLYEQ